VTAQAQTLEIASPTGKISPTSELESTIAPFIADKDVLDIGSINHVFLSKNRKRGWMFDFLLSQAAAVQGVDIELDQVERANAAGYPIVHGDAKTYLAGRQYDDVLATDLIEHLSNAGLFLAAARKISSLAVNWCFQHLTRSVFANYSTCIRGGSMIHHSMRSMFATTPQQHSKH